MSSSRITLLRERLGQRLALGRGAVIALACGVVALLVSLAAFGGTTEDVTEHHGRITSDVSRLRFFTDHRSGALVHVAKVLTDVGTPLVLVLLAIVASALLWWRGMRLVVACAPIVSLLAAGAAVAVLKSAVNRARPPVALHLVNESDASFPSGHSTDSAAMLLAVALVVAVFVFRRPLLRVLSVAGALVATTAIGLSRLVLGVHWPSDVLAGWALGVSVALFVTMVATVVARLKPPGELEGELRTRPIARILHVLTISRGPRTESHTA